MATLTEAREDLADGLSGLGFTVYDHVPGSIVTPCALISTGDPYVEEGDTFNDTEMKVNLEIFVITGTSTNATATKALDALITKVIFHTAEWHLDGASAPFVSTVNGSDYLTCRLALSKITNLMEGA